MKQPLPSPILIARDGDNTVWHTGHNLEFDVPYGYVDTTYGQIQIDDLYSLLSKGFWEFEDVVEKGRQRQFSSRSEAGRYAAQMRWGNRGSSGPNEEYGLPMDPTNDPELVLQGAPYKRLLDLPPSVEVALMLTAQDGQDAKTVTEFMERSTHKAVEDQLTQHYYDALTHPDAPPWNDFAVDATGFKVEISPTTGKIVKDGRMEYARELAKRRIRAEWVTEREHRTNKGGDDHADNVVGGIQQEKTANIVIGVSAVSLTKIANDERVKTQFESKTSEGHIGFGAQAHLMRATTESLNFGFHPSADPSKRPVYGSIMPRGIVNGNPNGTYQYGDCYLVLKPSARERTTFTTKDSLGRGAIQHPLNGSGKARPRSANQASTDAQRDAFATPKGTRVPSHPYVEAQIHGGVKASDIAKIVVRPEVAKSTNIREFAQKHGIALEVQEMFSPESEVAKRLVAQTIEELTRTIEAISKARQRQFSSRSEAGRYAAQIRWGNRGANATAAQQFVYEGEAEDMQELQRLIGVSQGLVGGLPEETPDIIISVGMTTEQIWTQWETDTDSVSMYEINGELVPSQRLNAANEAVRAVGDQTRMIVEKRRAAKGTSDSDRAAERDKLQDERDEALRQYNKAAQDERDAKTGAIPYDQRHKRKEMIAEAQKRMSEANVRRLDAENGLIATSQQNAQNDELKVVMSNLGVLGGKPQTTVKLRSRDYSSDDVTSQQKGVDDAMTAVSEVVPKAVIDTVTAREPNLSYGIKEQNALAHYDPATSTINGASFMTAIDVNSRGTIGHEYTHAAQYAIPQVRPLEAAYVARRVRMTYAEVSGPARNQPQGDTAFWRRRVPMRDKHQSETTAGEVLRDNFGREYAGRNYRLGRRTNKKDSTFGSHAFPTAELLSTGVESLVRNRKAPDTTDQDHRFWTVGVLLSLPPTATKAVDAIDKARAKQFSSRSEAGRYAAQIRWGNRSGGSASVEPPALTSPYSQIATRCRDAMDAHAAAGFTVETYDAKSLTREKKDELNQAWTTTMKAQYETGDKEDLNRRTNMAVKALEGVSTVGRLIVLRHPSGAIASIGLTYTREGMTTIAFAASSGIMKGSGSALFGHIVRDTARSGISSLKLDALPTAASFWKEMGFLPVKMKGQLSQMGMPTTIFNEIAGGIG